MKYTFNTIISMKLHFYYHKNFTIDTPNVSTWSFVQNL